MKKMIKNDNRGEMDELLGNEKQNTSKYEFSYLYEIKYVFKNYSFLVNDNYGYAEWNT